MSRVQSGIECFRNSLVIGMFVVFLDISNSDVMNPHLRGVDQYDSRAKHGSPSFSSGSSQFVLYALSHHCSVGSEGYMSHVQTGTVEQRHRFLIRTLDRYPKP